MDDGRVLARRLRVYYYYYYFDDDDDDAKCRVVLLTARALLLEAVVVAAAKAVGLAVVEGVARVSAREGMVNDESSERQHRAATRG